MFKEGKYSNEKTIRSFPNIYITHDLMQEGNDKKSITLKNYLLYSKNDSFSTSVFFSNLFMPERTSTKYNIFISVPLAYYI